MSNRIEDRASNGASVTAEDQAFDDEGDALNQIEFQLDGFEIQDPSSQAISNALSSDEIEMIAARLPDSKVEAGGHLMQEIGSIPDKMAFKIGEAAEMVGVKQYVLRYWESEFEMLRPRKSKNNQRVYSRRDVETAMMIKKLLYDDRFSIEGARAALRALKAQVKEEKGIKQMAQTQETAVAKLRKLVGEIRRVREIFA